MDVEEIVFLIIFIVDVSGIDVEKNFSIEVNVLMNVLMIWGECVEDVGLDVGLDVYKYKRECYFGSFMNKFILLLYVIVEEISVNVKNGVFKIVVLKVLVVV